MTEIAIASPSLPRNLVLFGGFEDHSQFLEETGFDGGLELHPMHAVSRLSRNLAELAVIQDEMVMGYRIMADDLVRSAHQSYISRSEGMLPHHTFAEKKLAVKGLIAFFRAETSLTAIADLQKGFRTEANPLPVVVYPEIGRNGGYSELPFSDVLFQPNVRNLKKWDVRTTDDLIKAAKAEGLTGIAWDGYHYQRRGIGGLAMEKWEIVLPMLMEREDLTIKETHISLGRTDRTEHQELMDACQVEMDVFINHPDKIASTTTGQMLRTIQDESHGNMRYVLETQLTKDNIPSGKTEKSVYKTLSGNIRTFLES